MQKLFLTLISLVHGFKLSNKVKPETNFKFVGDTAPMGYFDPLSFIDNKSEGFLKYAREAELQHSRVAMTSMIALPLIINILLKSFTKLLIICQIINSFIIYFLYGLYSTSITLPSITN